MSVIRNIKRPGLSALSILYDLQDKQPYITYYKGKDIGTFAPALLNTSVALGWPLAWLPTIIFHESSMNPKKQNSGTGATGLIQFIDSSASSVGSDLDSIYSMPGTKQLALIKKYYQKLQKQYGMAKSLADAYMLTFYPAAVGKSDSHVLGGSGTNAAAEIARKNPDYDIGGKGYITVGDINQIVSNW